MARDPAVFPRRTMLALCGLSPQVVTEMLNALAVHRNPPFVPTRVIRTIKKRRGFTPER